MLKVSFPARGGILAHDHAQHFNDVAVDWSRDAVYGNRVHARRAISGAGFGASIDHAEFSRAIVDQIGLPERGRQTCRKAIRPPIGYGSCDENIAGVDSGDATATGATTFAAVRLDPADVFND